MTACEKFERLCEILDKQTIYDSIENYLSAYDLDDFCDTIIMEQELEEELDELYI